MRPLFASVTLCSLVGCAAPPSGGAPALGPPSSPAPPASSSATATVATSEAGARALVSLSARLQGGWVAKLPSGKEVHESFRTISNDSALVESYRSGQSETMSVYHADGASLVLTHYCAQGNQPRLRLGPITDGTLVFRFVDVTNLQPGKSYLVEKRLQFVGDGLEQTETYRDPAGATDTTVFHFKRENAL